jgi:hypothetical protein
MSLLLPLPDTVSQALALAAGAAGAAITARFVAEKAFGWTYDGFKDRRRVRVTMHRAAFDASPREACFITVTNLSRSRDVEVTHVWMVDEPQGRVHKADRPLPRRLKPDESWETWVFLDELRIPSGEHLLHSGRVRLSTGTVLKSRPDHSVPAAGSVPGGPIEHPVTTTGVVRGSVEHRK